MVDSIYGNDSTASAGGLPFLTIQSAISNVLSGQTIWILPGTYTLSGGITIPNGTSMRGMSLQTVIIQLIATADTTLIIMGENCRVEDVTLNLISTGHYTLKGVVFGGTSSVTSKLRTSVVNVNNSTATSTGSSNVYGIEANGTGLLSSRSFSFNCIKGSTINVYSNGGGNKRGLLISSTNIVTTRDTNIYVAAPSTTSSSGSYVGVETNDTSNTGSVQLRTTTIGTVIPGGSYTASDILQTTPLVITNPTYLASPGIQIGPGTDLVTKTAGNRGFSTYIYPNTIYYGLQGTFVGTGGGATNIGYLWPGTQIISGTMPDTTTPPAYYRIQQPSIISGLSCGLNVSPNFGLTNGTNSITLTIRYTPIATGIIVTTLFTVTIPSTPGGTDTNGSFYNSSLTLNSGDRLHLYVSYVSGNGGNAIKAQDLTVQVDLF